jgi:hypothetical protein
MRPSAAVRLTSRTADRAEVLVQAARLDHGGGPFSEVKNGIGRASEVQWSSAATLACEERASRRPTHGAVSCPCPKPASTIARACAKPAAACVAY